MKIPDGVIVTPVISNISYSYEESGWAWLVLAPGGLSLSISSEWVKVNLNLGSATNSEERRQEFTSEELALDFLSRAPRWQDFNPRVEPKSAKGHSSFDLAYRQNKPGTGKKLGKKYGKDPVRREK